MHSKSWLLPGKLGSTSSEGTSISRSCQTSHDAPVIATLFVVEAVMPGQHRRWSEGRCRSETGWCHFSCRCSLSVQPDKMIGTGKAFFVSRQLVCFISVRHVHLIDYYYYYFAALMRQQKLPNAHAQRPQVNLLGCAPPSFSMHWYARVYFFTVRLLSKCFLIHPLTKTKKKSTFIINGCAP